jgi:hypothetical protein
MGYLLEIAGRKFDGVACDFMEPVEDVLAVVTYRQSVGGINPAGFDIENAQPSIWTSTKKDYFGIGKTLR